MGVELLDVDGVQVAVRRSPRARRVRLVAKAGRGVELVLPARGGEDTGRQLISAERMVERWYREQTRRVAAALIADLPEPHPANLRIADGTSRWGSCSRTGTISISWRLMLAPFHVLDYVVAHELCHLRHLDHSKRFWAEVEALRPDWRDAHQWLRQHGTELHAYDPACALPPLRIAA